jgi:lipopolysaccharide transport system ATP-binding protein
MAAIRRLCRRCAVLEKGKLLGILPIEQAIELYLPKTKLSGLDIDVSARGRDWGTDGKIARIVRARLPGIETVRFNDPFTIELTLDVKEPIPAAMVGFAMNTIEGQRVMTLDSDADGKMLSLKPGRCVVRMSLDRLPVSPGRYYCGAAIGGSVFYDIIDNFAQWEVHPGTDDYESDRSFGGCRLRPTIELIDREV